MKILQKHFMWEFEIIKNFKGVTLFDSEKGSADQMCYWFLLSNDDVLDELDVRLQSSMILNNKVPTNEIPFCCKVLSSSVILITEFYNCNHDWKH